jgi:hypothetical protein
MGPVESIFYAIGEIVFAVAAADGKVQLEEKKQLEKIVAEELKNHHYDYDVSHIIFQILDRQHRTPVESYEWGMKEIRLYSHYLSPALKAVCLNMMEKVAAAFPGGDKEENEVLKKFKEDIAPLHGDPVYYNQK